MLNHIRAILREIPFAPNIWRKLRTLIDRYDWLDPRFYAPWTLRHNREQRAILRRFERDMTSGTRDF